MNPRESMNESGTGLVEFVIALATFGIAFSLLIK